MDETILGFIDAWDEVASQMLESSREILQPGLTPSQRAERIRSESFVLSLGREEGLGRRSRNRNPETGNFDYDYDIHRIGALGLAERIRDWCFQQHCPIDCGPLFAFQSTVHELIEGAVHTGTQVIERSREIELDAIVDLFERCDRVVEDVEAFARVRQWTDWGHKQGFVRELGISERTWQRWVKSGRLVIENQGGNPKAKTCRIRRDCYERIRESHGNS